MPTIWILTELQSKNCWTFLSKRGGKSIRNYEKNETDLLNKMQNCIILLTFSHSFLVETKDKCTKPGITIFFKIRKPNNHVGCKEKVQKIFSGTLLWLLPQLGVQDSFLLVVVLCGLNICRETKSNWIWKTDSYNLKIFSSQPPWIWFTVTSVPHVNKWDYPNSKNPLLNHKWNILDHHLQTRWLCFVPWIKLLFWSPLCVSVKLGP